jgi:guanylate kinase
MSTTEASMTDVSGEPGDAFISDLRSRRRPRLFVVSGPSGVGKDTVIQQMRPRFPQIHFAVTATTRERRPGEIDGVDYYFLDRATFEERIDAGEFLESAIVYGERYGVPRNPIRHALERGQDVVVKVDVQGAATVRQIAPGAILIFLAPESMTELFRRLRARKTDDPDKLMRRFRKAESELQEAPSFDYLVFNEFDNVERSTRQIVAIIDAERSRIVQSPVTV